VFRGGPGDDTFFYLRGADQYFGGVGGDYFVVRIADGAKDSEMHGQAGNDLFRLGVAWWLEPEPECPSWFTMRMFGHSGNDRFDPLGVMADGTLTVQRPCATMKMRGGEGAGDWLMPPGVTRVPLGIDLGDGMVKRRDWSWSQSIRIASIENARGGYRKDVIVGSDAANVLVGGGSGDEIRGLGGDDVLRAQGGPDRVFGGDGSDILEGGMADDHLDGGAGIDALDGGDGTDTCHNGETYVSCELPL
jgi:Ca2+-binding RTX toxin-like protein